MQGINSVSRTELKKVKQTLTKLDNMPSSITEINKHHDQTMMTDKSPRHSEHRSKPATEKQRHTIKNKTRPDAEHQKQLLKHKTEKNLPELHRRHLQPNEWNSKLLEAINKTKAMRVDQSDPERREVPEQVRGLP